MQLLAELNTKFTDNLTIFVPAAQSTCRQIDIGARAIAALGDIVSAQKGLQPHQTDISLIFHEVFSDMVLTVYFTACALTIPLIVYSGVH